MNTLLKPVRRRSPLLSGASQVAPSISIPRPLIGRPVVHKRAAGRVRLFAGPSQTQFAALPRALIVLSFPRRARHRGAVLVGKVANVPTILPAVRPLIVTPRTRRARAPQAVYLPSRLLAGTLDTPFDLLESAVAFLQAQPSLIAAFGKAVWLWDDAPTDEPFPFATILDAAEDADYTSIDENNAVSNVDRSQLQVSIFATNKDAARLIGRQVESLLNDAPLTFSEGSLIYLRRQNRRTEKDPAKGPNGVDVWQRILMFKSIVERTFP